MTVDAKTSSHAPGQNRLHQDVLTVRKLEVDLSKGFEPKWHRNAFLTQFYNALSMSFPVGEQSFIDSVRDAAKLLPQGSTEHAALQDSVAQFIGQEATHRHVHALFNAQLEQHGLVNRWQHWATKRIARGQRRNMQERHWLAITVGYEHCTAVLADCILRHPSWLEGANPQLQTLWRWHAAEETEHRALAFDLYQAIEGNHTWRIRWYWYVLIFFALDAGRQTVLNLWRSGDLFKPTTWWQACQFFWGKDGAARVCTAPLLHYFRRDFHPDEETQAAPDKTAAALASQWLRANASSFRVIRSNTEP